MVCRFIVVFTDLSPLSLVVSQNAENGHAFRCTGPGAERLDVRIDGTAFEDEDILNRGVIVSSDDSTPGIIISTITIPATIENNDTSIRCISINFTSSDILSSSTATYLVQGQYHHIYTVYSYNQC